MCNATALSLSLAWLVALVRARSTPARSNGNRGRFSWDEDVLDKTVKDMLVDRAVTTVRHYWSETGGISAPLFQTLVFPISSFTTPGYVSVLFLIPLKKNGTYTFEKKKHSWPQFQHGASQI